jgi:prepilin-type N-terminal cleavage/methylation domain-containing protein
MIFVINRIQGLTFIEILIVIIIIGILAGTSSPRLRKTFNYLQLNIFSRDLQNLMNYLQQRSIVEGKIISLNIDNTNKKYWAKIQDSETPLKTYTMPEGIKIEIEPKREIDDTQVIYFSPDGQIDKVTVEISNLTNQNIILTTKGVFGGVKVQTQE